MTPLTTTEVQRRVDSEGTRRDVLIRQLQSKLRWGTGDPNGVLDAPKGTLYINEAGGAGTTLYVNEAGGTTWRAI